MTRKRQTIPGRDPFRSAAETLLRESGCVVRVWRKKMTGVAWVEDDDWGIEVPEPRGSVSYGVFAHEVAHQLLHRSNGSTPRWLEEIEAWEWSLATFARFDLPGIEKVEAKAAGSLAYAVGKALRRSTRKVALGREIFARVPDFAEVDVRDVINRKGEWE